MFKSVELSQKIDDLVASRCMQNPIAELPAGGYAGLETYPGPGNQGLSFHPAISMRTYIK